MNIEREAKFLKFEEEYCNLTDGFKTLYNDIWLPAKPREDNGMPYSSNARKRNLKKVKFQ
jgi:hypothetical protein